MFSGGDNSHKNLKIFDGIDQKIVQKIIENCEHRKYQDGAIIIMEGEDSNGEGYILTTGRVTVSIGGENITELSQGDIFGEIALLNEEQRTASIYAQGEIEVIVLNMEHIMEMLSSDNQINKTIISRIEENLERN